MNARPASAHRPRRPRTISRDRRGSALMVALFFAAAIALALGSYLALGRNSLRMAQRGYFSTDAVNLAEAGLEEALYCFNRMGEGVAPATAWAGWTLVGTNATRALAPFKRDQNAVGVVKVYVRGYMGSVTAPLAIAQATITPVDGSPPIVRTLQCRLKNNTGYSMNGLVALNGLTFKGQATADSFNSNPTNSPTGPWRPYSASIARANTRVIVPSGTITLGNGTIAGNLLVGPGVTPPPASQVTGTIQTDFAGEFKMPAYPTAAGVSRSYSLGATIPLTLPVAGHLPASDGKYYYFCNGATVANFTITTGRDVVIVGTNTRMASGVTLQGTGTCAVYIDGPVTSTGTVTNGSWAGALRIFTTTSAECSIGNNSQIVACLYAPNAPLIASGGGNTGMLVGYFLAKTVTATGHMEFHYDEALQPLSEGNPWQLAQWYEVRTAAERAALSALTGGFLW